jgi:hypothetical protein
MFVAAAGLHEELGSNQSDLLLPPVVEYAAVKVIRDSRGANKQLAR